MSNCLIRKGLACVSAIIFLFFGCDHTKIVTQSMTIKATASDNSKFTCKTVSVRQVVEKTNIDIEREQFNPGRFENLYPWSDEFPINASGVAVIFINRELIVDPSVSVPPAGMAPLSKNTFQVRISGCDTEPPVFMLKAVSGDSYSDEKIQVEVKSVSDAKFISQQMLSKNGQTFTKKND